LSYRDNIYQRFNIKRYFIGIVFTDFLSELKPANKRKSTVTIVEVIIDFVGFQEFKK